MASETGPEEEKRFAELLRVNAELAAEVRSLTLGRRATPRSGPLPASRRLAKLSGDLEKSRAELEQTRTQLDANAAELQALRVEREELLRHKAAQEREIAKLRSGFRGLFRRARARLRR